MSRRTKDKATIGGDLRVEAYSEWAVIMQGTLAVCEVYGYDRDGDTDQSVALANARRIVRALNLLEPSRKL